MHLGGLARAVEAAQEPALLVVGDQRLGVAVKDSRRRWTLSGSSSARCSSREPSWSQTSLVLGRVEVDVVEVLGFFTHTRRPEMRSTTTASGASIGSAAVR